MYAHTTYVKLLVGRYFPSHPTTSNSIVGYRLPIRALPFKSSNQIPLNPYGILVGGWATPLKNMKVIWDDEIPNIWENKKCSKPPTSINSHSITNKPHSITVKSPIKYHEEKQPTTEISDFPDRACCCAHVVPLSPGFPNNTSYLGHRNGPSPFGP